MFVDEMPERIAKIESEFATSNWEELRRTAHQLKGAAGSYGFTKLSSVAAEVENLLKNKASLEETEQKVQYLITLCRCATSDPPPEESSK